VREEDLERGSCVLSAATKRSSTFSRKKVNPSEKILATPVTGWARNLTNYKSVWLLST